MKVEPETVPFNRLRPKKHCNTGPGVTVAHIHLFLRHDPWPGNSRLRLLVTREKRQTSSHSFGNIHTRECKAFLLVLS